MGTPRRTALLPLMTRLALAAAPLALVATTAAAPAVAHAQDVFAQPVVELLPVGPISASGDTPVTVHVLTLDRSGAPGVLEGGKLTLTDGQTVALTLARPGLYTGTWTPKAATAPTPVQVSLKGKVGRDAVSKAWALTAQPPAGGAIAVAANPPQLTLGQDASATISFTLSGGAATAKPEDLAVLSSAGDVTNITALGNGAFTALYSPPAQPFPQVSVITVIDRRAPNQSYGSLVLPLVGKANFPVVGLPNSRVMVKVGAREFGPVAADAAGRATVPIIVPPGNAQASVVSILGDRKSESPLDLQVPPSKRVRLFPTLQSIPADPSVQIPVRVQVSKPDGAPDTAAQVAFTATSGVVTAPTHEGNGVYKAMYTPALAATAGQATISVNVADAKMQQADALTVQLVPARPAGLVLTPEPADLPEGATQFAVLAKLNGPGGAGVSGQLVDLQARGAVLNGTIRDLGNGDYQAMFVPNADQGDIVVSGTVKLPASGNPLARVVAFPDQDRLPTKGNPTTGVTIVALDRYGYPVAGVPVSLRVLQGGGAVPASVTTDANGMARVDYKAGDQPGVAALAVEAPGASTGVAVLLAPGNIGEGLELPSSGSAAHRAATDAWDGLVSAARVKRASQGKVVLQAPQQQAVAAKLELAADPATVPPGGTVMLRITARDAQGLGVAGQVLTVQTSAGQVSAVQDAGGGSYQASLTLPAEVSGSVQVAVTTAGGGVAAFADLPVSVGTTAAWGAEPTQPEAPVEPPKEPREKGEHPWLRLSAGYLGGLYSYQQTPATLQGPLYARTITVGGGAGDPAGNAGLQFQGRLLVPGLEYVGVELGFRTTNWSIELAEGFDAPISDWNNEFSGRVIGRYPIALDGGNQVSFGGRVGIDANDFLYFTQEEETDGSTSLLYQQLIVPGPTFGLEAGAELGSFFALVDYDMGFTDFQGVYSHNFELDLGVSITEAFFVQGDFGWNNRDTTVYVGDGDPKEEVGNLRDSMTMFGVQAGVQFR